MCRFKTALRTGERGFTLIELLVAMVIFSLLSITFYSILFSASDTANSTRAVTQGSAEARRGFNRLLRDTREASEISDTTDNGYSIEIDFDGNGIIEADPLEPTGNYEFLQFIFNEDPDGEGDGSITVTNGVDDPEVLIEHVDCLRQPDNSCFPVFTFASNNLIYDTDGDGITSANELDVATSIGNNNGILDGVELQFVDTVSYGMRITVDDRGENFYGEAQMRNFR